MEHVRQACCLCGLILSSLMISTVHAQTNPDEADREDVSRHIEHQLDLCMEEGDWTADAMRECASKASDEWQDELDALRGRLSRALAGDARDAFDASQEAWEASRDAEFRFISAYHEELRKAELGQGDLLSVSELMSRNAVLKDRAARLQRYLDGLEEVRE